MANICIITGFSGLIGGESVEFFSKKLDIIIGIDNDMRAQFCGVQMLLHNRTPTINFEDIEF